MWLLDRLRPRRRSEEEVGRGQAAGDYPLVRASRDPGPYIQYDLLEFYTFL